VQLLRVLSSTILSIVKTTGHSFFAAKGRRKGCVAEFDQLYPYSEMLNFLRYEQQFLFTVV
jgi:hypothetical protein